MSTKNGNNFTISKAVTFDSAIADITIILANVMNPSPAITTRSIIV